MNRLCLLWISAFAAPAYAQCRLCTPGSDATAPARVMPLSIAVEATLDLGRAAQTRTGGGGTITIDAVTGARRVSGTLADLGGFALKGTVRLSGAPFAPVAVSLPNRISLTASNGSTADVVDLRTDLRPNATLDAQGNLIFGFGGRLVVAGGVAGNFRGRIPISADYR